MFNLKPGYRPQPAVPLPTTAPRSVQVLSLREPSHAACGLDAEAAAARLALAPPSVQAFIKRWGHRSGIDDAYTATCSPRWEGAVLETVDEVPGHHQETSTEAAFRDRLEDGGEGEAPAGWEDPQARLALAPPSVAAFIARWGRREGIDAAASN